MSKETKYYVQSGIDDIPIEVSEDKYDLYLCSVKHKDIDYVVQTPSKYIKILIIID